MVAESKQEEKKSTHYGEYLAIAAGVVLVCTLTIVTFFDKEFDNFVASFTAVEETVEVAVDQASDDQIAQPQVAVAAPNYGYQPFAGNQSRVKSFEEMREIQRAAREEAMHKHNERMAKANELRTASFERMDQRRIDMRNRMETMRVKTQQIQLEMQQKMQAVYDEFHAI